MTTETIERSTKILLIEDNPGDMAYLKAVLFHPSDNHIELTCFERLSQALGFLAGEEVDIVLLDLSLPDSHGIETLTRLHAQCPHVPVVVLTGLNDEAMAIQALHQGAQDYVVKGEVADSLLPRMMHYAIERKRVEEELLRSQEQLRRAQKMEAVGRLAGGIAHDFNNLLTSILGFARFTQAQIGADHPSAMDVGEIIRAGERAAALTRQLLALGHRHPYRVEVLDLNCVIREMHRLLRQTLGEDIEIVTVFGERLPSVRADAGQIEQIIMNLAINSREAMPQGGKLTIATKEADLNEAFCAKHPGAAPGAYVMIVVEDTGAGMTDEVRERAFEPYFSTKDGGSGLGLATTYGIVNQFGGFIDLDSKVHAGTRVAIYLPAVQETIKAAVVTPDKEIPRGTETILLIEDEDLVRKLATRILEDLGYHVMPSRHGSTALEICSHHEGPIHLVVSDVVMPQLDGPEVFKRLRKIRGDLKVLFISGYTQGRLAELGQNEENIQLLPKPFTREELARKVREVLDTP